MMNRKRVRKMKPGEEELQIEIFANMIIDEDTAIDV